MENNFLVGANVLVEREGKVLLGLRKNCFSAGNWGLPGGHVEPGEKLADAAARELLEETGMTAEEFVFANVVNRPEGRLHHYVLLSFVAHNAVGEPELREPDRCEEWRWFNFSEMPSNIVESHHQQIVLFRSGVPFTD